MRGRLGSDGSARKLTIGRKRTKLSIFHTNSWITANEELIIKSNRCEHQLRDSLEISFQGLSGRLRSTRISWLSGRLGAHQRSLVNTQHLCHTNPNKELKFIFVESNKIKKIWLKIKFRRYWPQNINLCSDCSQPVLRSGTQHCSVTCSRDSRLSQTQSTVESVGVAFERANR